MERKDISKEKDFSTKIIDLNIPRELKIFLSGSWVVFVIIGHLFIFVSRYVLFFLEDPRDRELRQMRELNEEILYELKKQNRKN